MDELEDKLLLDRLLVLVERSFAEVNDNFLDETSDRRSVEVVAAVVEEERPREVEERWLQPLVQALDLRVRERERPLMEEDWKESEHVENPIELLHDVV